MCEHSKSHAKVLERRQNGLDSRGNVPAHMRAESEWAVRTLKTLDAPTAKLVSDDLLNLHQKAQATTGKVNRICVAKFDTGCKEIFGANLDRQPSPEQIGALILEGKYDFKSATDAINRDQKNADAVLYKAGRSGYEFEGEKGRKAGRTRRDSFSNTNAGITDRLNTDDEARDFFSTKTVHAKGMLEGDTDAEAYKKFQNQGAPFIGGASGTIQGLVMGLELQLKATPEQGDVQAKQQSKAQREKLIGVYTTALVAGGHHSVSECLIAAQKYGYFEGVTHPLDDYAKSMQELSAHLTRVGLPTDLSPKDAAVGDPWRKARGRVKTDLDNLRSAMAAEYRSRKLETSSLEKAFDDNVRKPVMDLLPDALAKTLDGVPTTTTGTARQQAIDAARQQITTLKGSLANALIANVEENPFKKLSLSGPLASTLDTISKELVGPA